MLGQRVDGGREGVLAAAAGRVTAGPAVTAAQYLLRDAKATTAAPTGVFDAATDAAVRRFQAATGAEEVNGLLGGESWPVLARPTQRGHGRGRRAGGRHAGRGPRRRRQSPTW